MSANTKWYVKVPVVTYEWIEAYSVTRSELYREYPNAQEILHWSEYEVENNE